MHSGGRKGWLPAKQEAAKVTASSIVWCREEATIQIKCDQTVDRARETKLGRARMVGARPRAEPGDFRRGAWRMEIQAHEPGGPEEPRRLHS